MALPPAVSPRRPRGLNARLVMVGVALTLAWLGVGYRLVVVQGTRAEEYAAQGRGQRLHTETLAAARGTIFDAEGRELALTVDSVTVYANPREVTDPEVEARYLASLTGQDPDRRRRTALRRRHLRVRGPAAGPGRRRRGCARPTSPASSSWRSPSGSTRPDR